MVRKPYFTSDENAPPPLSAAINRRVRFEEVDPMQMVWHGRYPSYFEDGRLAFGDRFGLGYDTFVHHRVMAPLTTMHIDYRKPLRLNDTMEVCATLHWCEAMRLDFSYAIINGDGEVCATGYTVQVLTEPEGSVLYLPPAWMRRFRQRWQNGEFV